MKIAVSFLKSNNYKDCILKINESKADYVHCDFCDGKYVETKNFSIKEMIKILKVSNKKLDIHLMVKDPMKYIDDLAMLNVENIIIHLDSCNNLEETIDYIKSIGIKTGIALNPDQEVSMIVPYLNEIDEVLVMSVYPGKGGQKFIENTVTKIEALNVLKQNYNFIIGVDGGINSETVSYLKNLNIDLLVSGSFVTDSEDYNLSIKELKI